MLSHKHKHTPSSHPWRCRLLLVVHFFHTSMFFLMVPSPLHDHKANKRTSQTSSVLAWGAETTREPRHVSGQKMFAKHKLSKRPALADCSHHYCPPLSLHYCLSSLPSQLCLAGTPGFSTTAGQTQAALANYCSSVWARNDVWFIQKKVHPPG